MDKVIIKYFDTWYATGEYAPTTLRGWFSAFKAYFDMNIEEFHMQNLGEKVPVLEKNFAKWEKIYKPK